MMHALIASIVADLREQAANHAKVDTQINGAKAYLELADGIEERCRVWWTEPLTLHEAADELHEPYWRIQKRVSAGVIPNVGRKHAPRVRRCDLYQPPGPQRNGPNVAGHILGQSAA